MEGGPPVAETDVEPFKFGMEATPVMKFPDMGLEDPDLQMGGPGLPVVEVPIPPAHVMERLIRLPPRTFRKRGSGHATPVPPPTPPHHPGPPPPVHDLIVRANEHFTYHKAGCIPMQQ